MQAIAALFLAPHVLLMLMTAPRPTAGLKSASILLLSALCLTSHAQEGSCGESQPTASSDSRDTIAGQSLQSGLAPEQTSLNNISFEAVRQDSCHYRIERMFQTPGGRSQRTFFWTNGRMERDLVSSLSLPQASAEQQVKALLRIFQEATEFEQMRPASRDSLATTAPGRFDDLLWKETLTNALRNTGDSPQAQKIRVFLLVLRALGIRGIYAQIDNLPLAALECELPGHPLIGHQGGIYHLVDPTAPDGLPILPRIAAAAGQPLESSLLEFAADVIPWNQELSVETPTGSRRAIILSAAAYEHDVLSNLQFAAPARSADSQRTIGLCSRGEISEEAADSLLALEWEKSIAALLAMRSPAVQNLAIYLTAGLHSREEKALALLRWTQTEIRQMTDTLSFGTTVSTFNRSAFRSIFDGHGECLDKSILFSTLCHISNIDTIVLLYKRHALVGIAGDFQGASYRHEGRKYYFAETTDPKAMIGQMIPEYIKAKPLLVVPNPFQRKPDCGMFSAGRPEE